MLYNNGSMEAPNDLSEGGKSSPHGGYHQYEELRVNPGRMGKLPLDNKAARLAQKEIVLRLLAGGMPIHEVAKQTKTSGITIAKWFRDPVIMERLKELNVLAYQDLDAQLKKRSTATVERIQQASDEALDKVLELMHGADSEVVQMRCAFDVLDRNPETTKTHKVQSTKRVVHIDADLVNAVLGAEKEAGITING